jgi:hypothetical protein
MVHELDKLFAEAKYPGDMALADAYPNEWEATLKRLQGKHWRSVVVKDFDSQGGITEGVQALGLKGFHFFLPGLLRLALTEPEHRYPIVDALLTRFTHPDEAAEECARQQAIVSALTVEQRDFLARFFAESLAQEETLCPVMVKCAVENLKNGQVRCYRQSEIESWVGNISGLGPTL